MRKKHNDIAIIICFIIFFAIAGAGVYFGMIKDSTGTGETTTMPQESEKVVITTTKEGTGAGVVNGQTVSVNYTGRLSDGTVFDSNTDPKFNHVEPIEFVLGAGDVIAGWEQGLLGMKVGEKRTLVIPSSLAYGASGRPGTIPPNAELTFDVELLAIK